MEKEEADLAEKKLPEDEPPSAPPSAEPPAEVRSPAEPTVRERSCRRQVGVC